MCQQRCSKIDHSFAFSDLIGDPKIHVKLLDGSDNVQPHTHRSLSVLKIDGNGNVGASSALQWLVLVIAVQERHEQKQFDISYKTLHSRQIEYGF